MYPVTRLPQRHQRRIASSTGFTLVELIAVMGLMMIVLTAFAITTIRPSSAANLASASRDVSNYLTLARAEAVRRQTVVRLVFPMKWPGETGRYSRMSLWRWEPATETFVGMTGWAPIPEGVILEPELPEYVKKAPYARHDGATVRGDYALTVDGPPFAVTYRKNTVPVRYIEFLPTGAARLPGGEQKRIVLVLVEGIEEPPGSNQIIRTSPGGDRAQNWAQINVETLTGKVRIYRP